VPVHVEVEEASSKIRIRGQWLKVVWARGSTPNDIDLQNKKGDMPNNIDLPNIKNRANLGDILLSKIAKKK
jgi:hypothetical protein